VQEGMRNSNRVALLISVLMACLLGIIAWRLKVLDHKQKTAIPAKLSRI